MGEREMTMKDTEDMEDSQTLMWRDYRDVNNINLLDESRPQWPLQCFQSSSLT